MPESLQLLSTIKSKIEQIPNSDLRKKIFDWLKWDKDPVTHEEIIKLVESNDQLRLSQLLLQRQCFGTAGIRGLMEPGFNGLNKLVIIQTSQGLAKHVTKWSNDSNKRLFVVIGYDGRHNSKIFARLTTNVFREAGFNVALFSKIVPTPFVSFATRMLSASIGIVITSSHNPKNYNGYKVLGPQSGAQILSPHDTLIQDSILNNLEPWNDELWITSDDKFVYNDVDLMDPLEKVSDEYYRQLINISTRKDLVEKSDLRIVYTALHGVGHEYLKKMFEIFGFKNHFPVESQMEPDPEFPTVDFPNPEEGQGVFDESYKTAKQSNSRLIFAIDPDADRFCFGELCSNEWRIFNGNEIGALFGWWIWQEYTLKYHDTLKKNNCYMISSAVSSKILETYANHQGFNFVETLTGFKWMANKAYDIQQKNEQNKVLFCFEEAIGFMTCTNVYDKDGISAAATMLQMAAYLRSQGLTFTDKLNEIYTKYGFHYSINSYYHCYEPAKIKKIFNRIMNIDGKGQGSYIKEVNGVKVTRVRDLCSGYDSAMNDKKARLPSTCMLTFYFENGSVITLRTSGTEPKIKYYSEIIGEPGDGDWEKIKDEHKKLIDAVLEVLLEPKKNELIPKKD